MITLDKITLVSIACVRVGETIEAIRKSTSGIYFADVKLFTHEDILADDFSVIKIDNLDYEKYNRFVVYELYKHIETDYVLIIQDDGYVINPDKWMNDFLEYDYIGAPWPLPSDSFSFRDIYGNIIRVGNGGFSLRSKKILSLPTKLEIPWRPYYGYYNEDGFFTCHNRHIFEAEGCKFADIDIAKYFSQESEIEEVKGITPFGFHGKWSKYYKK